MKRLLGGTLSVCVLVLTFFVCDFISTMKTTIAHLDSVTQHADQAVTDLHATIQKVNDAADKDQKYYDAAARELPKTGRAIRELVDYTNQSLNEPKVGAIPVFNHALSLTVLDIDSLTNHADRSLDTLTAAGDVTIEAWGHTADEISARMNDQRIDEVITNLTHTTEHLDLTAMHVDNISGMAETEFRRLTKPASLAKQVGMGALDFGAKVGSIFAGFAK